MRLKGVINIPPAYRRDTAKRRMRRTQTYKEFTFSAFKNKDTLIMDIYSADNKGEYVGRAAVDSKGNYAVIPPALHIRLPKKAINLLGESWKYRRIESLLGLERYGPAGYLSWSTSMYPIDSLSSLVFEDFVGKKDIGECLGVLRDLQDKSVSRRYRMKQQRKQERIDAEMDKVPCATDEFYEYCKEMTALPDVMVEDKPGQYRCSCCNQIHSLTELSSVPKLHKPVICPDTGKEAIYKGAARCLFDRKRIIYFCKNDDDKLVVRYFDAETLMQTDSDGSFFRRHTVAERIRLVDGVGIFYGLITYGDEFEQEWWDKDSYNNITMSKKSLMYPTNLLEGTEYEHLGVEYAALKGWILNYSNILWHKDRRLEYVIKMGLERLAYQMSQNYYSPRILSTCNPMLGLDKQRINRLKQLNGDFYVLEWLLFEKDSRFKISDKTIRWFSQKRIHTDELDFVTNKMSPEQIKNYITKQSRLSGDSVKQVITTWHDYIKMARNMDFDIEDDIVYKTKDLKKRHDALVIEWEKQKDSRFIMNLEKTFPKAAKVLKKYKKYAYQNDRFMIVVPNGIGDIVSEGRTLHHCVAASDRYLQRIENEETLILFLRKTEEPDIAYYTLEVEPGGTVRQKRTMFDRQGDDIGEVTEFLREWQKYIKKFEEDKEAADKAAELRRANFVELEQTKRIIPAGDLAGKLLADVLKDDLLEVM